MSKEALGRLMLLASRFIEGLARFKKKGPYIRVAVNDGLTRVLKNSPYIGVAVVSWFDC